MKKWRPLHLRDIIDPVLSQRLNTSTLEAGELRGAMEHLADALNDRFSQLFPGEDEPEYPEATVAQFFKPEPAPEDPPDYSCPICGEDSRGAECVHGSFECITAANRRIAQLTRERDEWENECKVQIRQAEAERDGIRAQAIQDTKDAAVKALEDEGRVSPILRDTMMYQHAADIIRNRI